MLFENIYFQSKMLLNLINDLMDLAKINSFNFKFNDCYFDMIDLIQKAFDTVKFTAKQKNLSLKQEFKINIQNPSS